MAIQGKKICNDTRLALKLVASASSGCAGPRGIGLLQVMLQEAGPVGCCYKVLTEHLFTGFSFLGRFWAFCPWTFCFRVIVPGVVGRYAVDTCLYWLRVAGLGV